MRDAIIGRGCNCNGVKHHICTNRVTQNDQNHSVDKSIVGERNHSSSKHFTDVYSAVMTQNMTNRAMLRTPDCKYLP